MTVHGRDVFDLETIELSLNGGSIAAHLYSALERESLGLGGVQQLFTGHPENGEHTLTTVITTRYVKVSCRISDQ